MHAKSPLKHYTTLMVRWGYYHFGCCRRKVPETRVFLLYANIIKKDSLLQTPARKVPTAVPSESSLYRQLLCPLSFTPHQHPQDGRSCLGFFSFYQRGFVYLQVLSQNSASYRYCGDHHLASFPFQGDLDSPGGTLCHGRCH